MPNLAWLIWTLVAVIAVVLHCLVIIFFITSLIYGHLMLHRKPMPDSLLLDSPGVSIIKPLMGADCYLKDNLENYFKINYPKLELLYCVHTVGDPACAIVQELQSKYPLVKCRLFIGGQGIVNPLVDNIAPAYKLCQYDLVWICTSRVTGTTEVLLDMVAKARQPDVAIVHQLPFSKNHLTAPVRLEQVYFGCSGARYYLAFHVLGFTCFTGMSYMVKKSMFTPEKDFLWFGKFLAEDFFLANHFHRRGLKLQLSSFPALQNVEVTWSSFIQRMVRWQKLRLNLLPFVAGVLEPLGGCFSQAVMMSFAAYHFKNISPFMWFPLHCFVWCFLDYIQLWGVQGHRPHLSIIDYLQSWLLWELLTFYVYIVAIRDKHYIVWGQYLFKLSNYGRRMSVYRQPSITVI